MSLARNTLEQAKENQHIHKVDGAENFENAIISVIPKVLAQLCRLKINVKINVKRHFYQSFYASFRQGFSISQTIEYLHEKGMKHTLQNISLTKSDN